MLKEHFTEEHEWIIYLTQEEIVELKTTIEATRDPRWEAWSRQVLWESFNAFIAEQKTEGLSLSDILSREENIPSLLRQSLDQHLSWADDIAHEGLFGDEGVFTSLDISSTAQDHLATAMSVSFTQAGLWLLQEKIQAGTLGSQDIQDIMNMGGEIDTRLAAIKTVIEVTPPTIGGNGELNKIFMQTQDGVDFFSQVISGDITADNVQETLEAANVDSSDQIVMDLSTISARLNEDMDSFVEEVKKLTPEQMQSMLAWIATANSTAQTAANNENITRNEGEKTMWEKFMDFFKDFFWSFIDIWRDKEWDTDSQTQAQQEQAVQKEQADNARLISLIDDVSESQRNNSIIVSLREKPETATRLRKLFESISTSETFEESFKDMFTLGVDGLDKITKVWTILENHWFLQSLPEWTSNLERDIMLIEEYSRYRNSDGVKWLNDDRTQWEEWAEKRHSEEWAVAGK